MDSGWRGRERLFGRMELPMTKVRLRKKLGRLEREGTGGEGEGEDNRPVLRSKDLASPIKG
jgi:hypothetical protein